MFWQKDLAAELNEHKDVKSVQPVEECVLSLAGKLTKAHGFYKWL